MPVTSYDRKRNAADLSSALGPLNTTSFLFDDDEKPSALPNKSSTKTTPPNTKTYLQVQQTADGFPKLIRRDDNGEQVSGSSAALDLALAQPKSEQQLTDRATASRHRISLPPSALSNGNLAPLNSILANANDAKSAANNRRSMEVKFSAETKRPALMASPPHVIANGVPKAQASYSTNDIPTLKSINSEHTGGVLLTSPPTQSSNIASTISSEANTGGTAGVTSISTSINNINNTINNRQSQDFTTAVTRAQENNIESFNLPQSGLQAAAAPFGTIHTQEPNQMPSYPPQNMVSYNQSAYYGGYGVGMLNTNLSNMNLGGGYGAQGQWPTQMSAYQQGGYAGYQQHHQNGQVNAGASRHPDSQRNMMQQRKQQAEEMYNTVPLSELVGQIYGLCKDQHGCRYLQKKLEERNEQDIHIIFDEVKDHFSDLMVDPFGNYLCQRLLEYANDEQRTILVQNAVPAMPKIALNQHGTRALQKMIEFISTSEQTNLIIEALRFDVVQLVQDLNGNHVIQKCLNHLSSEDSEFIFQIVGANCVVIGTHRHGCCVLQRCIDHATGAQKGALVDHIIGNAYSLVQDPFGNYVVQYIVDLTEPAFTEPLCQSFGGCVAFLSKQKFSSNVIEKVIRCASPGARRALIQEIIPEVEKLLRDSFANYVVQTALDYADEELKPIFIDHIRPMLPAIRHTPYGRRIQSKIQEYDNGGRVPMNSNLLPTSTTSTAPPNSVAMSAPYSSHASMNGRANRMGMVGPPSQWGSSNGFGPHGGVGGYLGGDDINAPTPQRNQAYTFLNGTQNHQNYTYGGQGFRQQPPYGHF